MPNIKLTLEYDGTNYHGWQSQTTLPTVQGALKDALKVFLGEEINVIGASRTDAGVHAYGQVASFKTASSIPCAGIMYGVNSLLPVDIVVKAASFAHERFDARRGSKGKTYVYRLQNHRTASAISRNYCWAVYKPLDLDAMREAARHFIGEMDFTSFMAADSDALHPVRKILSVEIFSRDDGFIEVEVKGTAFLRHMVRIMVGTLVSVGRGTIKPRDIKGIIDARQRSAATMTAPPKGLFLMKVEY